MPNSFDLIVLGSGPSSTRVVTRCAKENWSIAVIDPIPIGGTCALRGCNPKKVLVRAAELVDRARIMAGNGTNLGTAQIDWADLIRFKRTFTDPITPGKERQYAELGIEVIVGNPRFTSHSTLEVNGRTLSAKKFLIATGASPAPLEFQGAELLTSSDEFMELDTLPKRVTFVGGGYISFEFAHVAARAGADVSIIDRSQPLARYEPELVQCLIERSKTIGIAVHAHTAIESTERQANGSFLVRVSTNGQSKSIETDLLVHGAGRVPNVDGLDLDKGEIRYDKTGIEVNDYFQSVSNDAVYATGDVVAGDLPPLTPAANYEGRAVARNLLEGNVAKNEHPDVASAVFSVPNLAAIGLTEAKAQEKGIDYEIRQGDWAGFSSMKKIGETHAMYKIVIDKKTQRIMGAHLLGPEAAEMINMFALAMKMNAMLNDLSSTLFVFPTFISDIESMI